MKQLLRIIWHKLIYLRKTVLKVALHPFRGIPILRLPARTPISINDRESGVENTLLGQRIQYERDYPNFVNIEPHWRYKEFKKLDLQPPCAHKIEDVTFWGHYGGNFFTKERRLIKELSPDVWGTKYHDAYSKLYFPKGTRLKGITLSLCTKEASTNYFHWLFDLLPKVKIIQGAGYDLSNFDQILLNWEGAPFQQQTLDLLGIRPEQIIRTDSKSHYHIDELVTSTFKDHHYDCDEWMAKWLAEIIIPKKPERIFSNKLYLSRSNCSFRRLIQEEELTSKLVPLGFDVLHPDNLTINEQAYIFNQADCVIGPHGSAMTNMIFSKPGTMLIEFMTPNYVDLTFWVIPYHLNLDHHVIFSEEPIPDSEHYPNSRTEDIRINPESAWKYVSEILEKASLKS